MVSEGIERRIAETTPTESESVLPKGLPIAATGWPTTTRLESPSGTGSSACGAGSTRITPTSSIEVVADDRRRRPGRRRRTRRRRCGRAPPCRADRWPAVVITCALVRITPLRVDDEARALAGAGIRDVARRRSTRRSSRHRPRGRGRSGRAAKPLPASGFATTTGAASPERAAHAGRRPPSWSCPRAASRPPCRRRARPRRRSPRRRGRWQQQSSSAPAAHCSHGASSAIWLRTAIERFHDATPRRASEPARARASGTSALRTSVKSVQPALGRRARSGRPSPRRARARSRGRGRCPRPASPSRR